MAWTKSQWEEIYRTDSFGWHLSDVNRSLQKFFHELVTVGHGSSLHIFVPLCGKTTDMLWLAEKGHTVVGVEFVKMPIMNFFAENNLSFTTECVDIPAGGSQLLYRCSNEGKNITILHSSIFDVTDGVVGRKFHAIWDRASLSAINPEDRLKYVDLMRSILVPGGRCLLDTDRYDPKFGGPPPHSFSEELLHELFEESFHIRELDMEEFAECEKEEPGRLQFAHEKYRHLLTLK